MKKNVNVKISFAAEPLFFVNKKKGSVTCRLKGELSVPCIDFPVIEGDKPYRYYHTILAIGVATCSPDDEFDANRGKRIALAKAENEAYNLAKKYLVGYQRFFEEANEAVIDFYEKAARATKHNKEYIIGLSDKNNPNYKEEILPPQRGRTAKEE